MPNVIKLTVENPDEILNPGAYATAAVIRLQTATTQAGAYADVSGTGSTPTTVVTTGVRIYTAYDPNGLVSSWYRTRFENAGATRLSDWTPAFQVGDETAGMLCSLYDVQQELGGTSGNDDENILEKIRQVSWAIERYIGQWMAPRPTNPADTTTLTFDVPYDELGWSGWGYHKSLLLDRGARLVGIRTATTVGIAYTDQPDTGGAYTSATAADVMLRPWPSAEGPALRLVFSNYPTGAVSRFYPGRNTVSVTGSFGYAAVPADIQGVAARAVVRRFIGKGGGGTAVAIGPAGTEILLPDMSGADRLTLQAYKVPLIG